MWLLPTLDRIDKLKVFLETAKIAKTCTPGMVLVDEEDMTKNKEHYEVLDLPNNWIVMVTKAITMGDKVREVWPSVVNYRSRWVGLLNDDHYIVTPEWDRILVSALDGKNFTSSNDRRMAPMKAATATAWSMDLLNAVGWPIYPPELKHLFIDDVWENLGRMTGCWRVCMNAVVEHKHVLFGTGSRDETHNKVYGAEFPQKPGRLWDMDKAVFENFMKHDFNDVVQKIKKLQDRPRHQTFNPNYSKRSIGLLTAEDEQAYMDKYDSNTNKAGSDKDNRRSDVAKAEAE